MLPARLIRCSPFISAWSPLLSPRPPGVGQVGQAGQAWGTSQQPPEKGSGRRRSVNDRVIFSVTLSKSLNLSEHPSFGFAFTTWGRQRLPKGVVVGSKCKALEGHPSVCCYLSPSPARLLWFFFQSQGCFCLFLGEVGTWALPFPPKTQTAHPRSLWPS